MAEGGRRKTEHLHGDERRIDWKVRLVPSAIRHLPSAFRCLWPVAFGLWPLGCTKDLQLIQDPPNAVAATTTGPWASMIYAARTDSGVIVIDLGWTGSEDVLPGLVRQLGAAPADVRFVFLTHAHRDHIAAWPLVRQARVILEIGRASR